MIWWVAAALAGESALWGAQGELWDPAGRLPDVSRAGYQGGAPIPDLPVAATVTDFGAVGDGVTDDTAAIQAAIDATTGVLLFPPGTYAVHDVLTIEHSDVVLRGDDATLAFQVSLTDVLGAQAQWSWNGGLIWVRPTGSGSTLTAVTGPAERGDTTLTVADPSGLQVGQLVELRLTDDQDRTLGWHLHNDQAEPGDCTWQETLTIDWPVRIAAIDGDVVTLDQALRLDVRESWTPELRTLPALEQVGIESLTLTFPDHVEYPGHLDEAGYNAIFFKGGVVDSWIRDVTLVHVDNGILLDQLTKHVTVQDITLQGRLGHHGFNIAYAADCLFTQIHYTADFVHAFTFDHRANGNVLSRVTADGDLVLELDHHRDSPFDNVVTAMHAPTSWANGGSWCAGEPGGARSTFWNLEGTLPAPYWDEVQVNLVNPGIDWDFVQCHTDGRDCQTADAEWIEEVPDLLPRNLHLAQRAVLLDEPYADTGLSDTSPPSDPEPTGCGCGGGAPAGAWLLGLLVLVRRRSTRAG